ncbi:MAG: hypothetical protein AABY16_03635 [Nanoarchaeota archaeon]
MSEDYLEITVDVKMPNDKYIEWVVERTADTLARNPSEVDITMAAYRVHRGILQRRGATNAELTDCDERLVRRTSKIVSLRRIQNN